MIRTAVDAMAHILYCPALLGRQSGRATRWHNIHLIPGRWLAHACAWRNH